MAVFSPLQVSGGLGDRRYVLVGELDMLTSPDLLAILQPSIESAGDLTLDLADLRFVDSFGIRALVDIARGLDGHGSLVLASPRELVARVLKIIAIDQLPNLRVVDAPA